MSHFKTPALEYMSEPVITIDAGASIQEADRVLDARTISALAVTRKGQLAGILSRTDLLNASEAEPGESFRLPDVRVETLMTAEPITVSKDTAIDEIARRMLKEHVHRVFVAEGTDVLGVVSTRDLMRAVYDKRVRTPAIEIATKSIIRVKPDDPIPLAVDRLEKSNKHGLVVVDDGWPVGIFSQRDALSARAHAPETPVADVMETKILCLPPGTQLYRAACQALALNARRILLVDEQVEGVISTFDFARIVK